MLGPQKISQTAVEEVLQELPKDDADEDDIGFLECKGRSEWLTGFDHAELKKNIYKNTSDT